MEDIRRRVEFSHVGIQIQAIEKLYNEVKKKVPGGKLLTASTPEFLELKALWQYTADEQGVVARHACRLWIQLLQENSAEFTYVQNGFLNQVPTAKNLQGIIEGISELLELQILLKTARGELYVCPYSVRSPPHPFITVLMNRPADSWPLLLEQVSAFISNHNQSISHNAILCLDPFLKFVLLDPTGSEKYRMIRTLLKTTLIDSLTQIMEKYSRSKCFTYLIQLLSEMQVMSMEDVAQTTQFCAQLLSWYQSHVADTNKVQGERLGAIAVCLLVKSQQHYLGIVTIGRKLLDAARAQPEILGSDCNLSVLSELILKAHPSDNVNLLNLVKSALKSTSDLSPLCCGFVYMAAINLVAAPSTIKNLPYQKVQVSMATEIINIIQNRSVLKHSNGADTSVVSRLEPEVYSSQAIVQLARAFNSDIKFLEQWPGNLKQTISSMKTVPLNLTNLLVAVLIQIDNTDVCKLTVARIIEIAKQQPSQAPFFLPVFLYALNKKACLSSKLCIMEALPKLATHKYCVPSVLKVIQSLGLNTKLKSLTIRLLTDLWKLQDRCFPMLLSAIADDKKVKGISMETVSDDILIAKAAAIKEICQHRPEQHGTEVLAPLSDILDTCTDDRGGPAAALALESLYYICQSEVIDIISTWKVLESKLLKENRPAVIERICDLLSLVPELPASSKAYEEFLEETVRRLWLYTQSGHPKVVVAAFHALSKFGPEHFKLSHFKYKIVEEFVLQAQATIEQSDNEGDTIDSVIPSPPGVCYIRLLQDQDKLTLQGYASFLSSLVGKEFKNLPRGIYYSSTYKHGTSSRLGKAVASIPALIQTQYQNTNQPGLRPGLAASSEWPLHHLCLSGVLFTSCSQVLYSNNQAMSLCKRKPNSLQRIICKFRPVRDIVVWERVITFCARNNEMTGLLFCYDPPVAVSRDGRPRLHYIMSHGKNYQQMFQSLLNDVSIPATDWHMMTLMPTAWSLFVERLFGSMIMARKAEIDLQRNRDYIDEKEAEEMKLSAWLWVRDSIVDVIKKSSKGNPSVQANSILALTGLATCAQRYVVSLDREERRHIDDITDHMTHSHWMMTVIDSCLSIIDIAHQPKSSLIGLCQQRSVNDRLPASILAQAAGILAVAELVPILMNNYVENIYAVLDKLLEWLPGQAQDDECPPVLHLSRGIAFGKFVAKLVNESFADIEGMKGSVALMKGLDALENCCFSNSSHRIGPMVGLGLCLSALCQDGKTESRVHVVSVTEKLFDQLNSLDTTDEIYQVCCVSVAIVISTGFISNVVKIEMANAALDKLSSWTEGSNLDLGALLSLGLLCNGLVIGGHPTVVTTSQTLYSDWMKLSHDAESPPMTRLAAMAGLMALTGSEKLLMARGEGTADLPSDIKIDAVIKTACQLMTSCDDVITQGSVTWLLGNLYLSLNSSPQSSSAVPSTYSYLPDTSILRATVDFLIHACKQGPEHVQSEEVEICLKTLQEKVTGSLPPLNWAGILSPLMKLPFSEEVKIQCVQLALKQCVSSSSGALFISSWCVPPLYNTLPIACQWIVLSNCDALMRSVTPAVFQNFLDKSCHPAIIDVSEGRSLCIAALKGLNSALAVTDPPESTVSMLYKMVTKVCDDLKQEINTTVLQALSECLELVPVQQFDEITDGDCTDNQAVIRGTFIRCYLVGAGKQPIAVLNSCIDAAFNIDSDQERVLYYLCVCFYKMTQVDSKHTRVTHRIQWLLEIMGHTRNIANGLYQVSLPPNKVIEFAIQIVSAAICTWTSKMSSAVFDLDVTTLGPSSLPQRWCPDGLEQETCDYRFAVKPLEYLRCCIGNLEKEPWNQILPKVIDWLLTLTDLPETTISSELKHAFKDCLHSLRSCPDYCKVAVWTRAVAVP